MPVLYIQFYIVNAVHRYLRDTVSRRFEYQCIRKRKKGERYSKKAKYHCFGHAFPLFSSYSGIPNAQSVNHDDGTRIQALALTKYGITHKIITTITKVSKSSIYRLKAQARERSYNLLQSKKLLKSYVTDTPRSGRPIVIIPEVKDTII